MNINRDNNFTLLQFSIHLSLKFTSHLSSIHFRFDFRFHLHSRMVFTSPQKSFPSPANFSGYFLVLPEFTSNVTSTEQLFTLRFTSRQISLCLERQLTCFTSQLVLASHSLQISNDVEYYLTSCLISPHFRLVSSFNQLQASLRFT